MVSQFKSKTKNKPVKITIQCEDDKDYEHITLNTNIIDEERIQHIMKLLAITGSICNTMTLEEKEEEIKTNQYYSNINLMFLMGFGIFIYFIK